MAHITKTIKGSRRLLSGAVAIAILAVAVEPVTAQVHKKTFKLYPNPKFIACAGTHGGPTLSSACRTRRRTLGLSVPPRSNRETSTSAIATSNFPEPDHQKKTN